MTFQIIHHILNECQSILTIFVLNICLDLIQPNTNFEFKYEHIRFQLLLNWISRIWAIVSAISSLNNSLTMRESMIMDPTISIASIEITIKYVLDSSDERTWLQITRIYLYDTSIDSTHICRNNSGTRIQVQQWSEYDQTINNIIYISIVLC